MCFDSSITHTAEAEYATAKTSVWWDIENCPVPKGWDAHSIAKKLNSALVNLNYRGPLTISAYGNTDLIPKAVQQALSSAGISLNHVPSGKKDASDKKILVDMFLWVLENPAPANLMLISGDGDFSYALNRLRMLRYNILLAHPLQASPFLVASARTSWMWRSLIASGCHSSRSCCSFGSEMSSQDASVSEHALSTQAMDFGSGSSKAARKKLKDVLKELNQQETNRMKLQKKCSETGESELLCNVACKSIEVFTTGKEPAAQALVDAKDSDLKSQDAQESEKSGREFWQDFKERLDKNGVAPLNVDHVFSELSRDFHVPKEVRECFEAIFKKLEPTQNDIEIEKLESMLKQGLEIESNEPGKAPAEPTENLEGDMTKKKSTVIEDKYEPYVCTICNVVCAHPSVFESHHKGRKHVAKFKLHIDAMLDNKHIQEEVIQDNGLPKDMTKELQIKPVKAPENIDDQRQELREGCDEENFQTIEEVCENDYKSLPNAECIFTELNPEFPASEESRECIDAIFKKPEVSQDANLTRELESIPSQNLEMNSGDSEGSSAGGTEHPEEYMDMKKEKVAKDKKAELKAYVCSICSVICLSPTVFEAHLMGRKHAKGVKKHAEVLFDDKKILEQSLEENVHSRDAAEELQIESKDAQVSIKEVTQISKARVDNKDSEQILSVEFAEPKEASRERFDSIVKRLDLFMEKTSKQTLVESEKASEGKKHAATLRKHVPLVKKEVAVV
uniref:C2H2-type domain-containing protein n=1 Tax=Brassica campestris TaxID=3711 RepID=M4D919_BRACM